MVVSGILVAGGYAVSADDSPIHGFGWHHYGTEGMLGVHPVHVGIVEQTLALQHVHIAYPGKVRILFHAFLNAESLIFPHLVGLSIPPKLAEICRRPEARNAKGMLIFMGRYILHRLAHQNQIYQLGEFGIVRPLPRHVYYALLKAHDRPRGYHCHAPEHMGNAGAHRVHFGYYAGELTVAPLHFYPRLYNVLYRGYTHALPGAGNVKMRLFYAVFHILILKDVSQHLFGIYMQNTLFHHCFIRKANVYVRQPSGSTENEYHPCLICDGENYTKDDPYCNVSNWNDNTNPDCSMSAEVVVDGNSKVVEGQNGSKTFYNPSEKKIQANEKISYIIIRGYENGTNKEIIHEELDVSKMTDEKIYGINLIEYFPKENGKIVTARYEITVLDQGGNESRCLMDSNDNGPDITIIMDEAAPKCELKQIQNCGTDKYVYFNTETTKDNWSKQNRLKVLISDSQAEKNIVNDFNNYKYSLVKKADGRYYGYVKDEAGNVGTCYTDVQIEMCPGDEPYCLFTKDAPTKWLKSGEVANLAVDCYVDETLSSNYDKTKLVSDNKLGTPAITKEVKNKGNNPDRTEYQIKYTATTEKKAGKDYVSVGSGFFKTTNNKVNEAIKSKEIKIDAVPPTIKYSPNKTKESGGWYKVSDSSPLVITATCIDSNSGVKEFAINNSVINKESKEFTFKDANNPYTITSKCTDNAGNTPTSSTLKVYTKVFSRDKDCGVELYKECEHKDCKCKTYKSCRAKACDCETIARCKAAGCASSSWCTSYTWQKAYTVGHTSKQTTGGKCINKYSAKLEYIKTTKKNGVKTYHYQVYKCVASGQYVCGCNYYNKSLSKCGCALREKCRTSACGCETYKTCRTKGCGVEKYKECWHY